MNKPRLAAFALVVTATGAFLATVAHRRAEAERVALLWEQARVRARANAAVKARLSANKLAAERRQKEQIRRGEILAQQEIVTAFAQAYAGTGAAGTNGAPITGVVAAHDMGRAQVFAGPGNGYKVFAFQKARNGRVFMVRSGFGAFHEDRGGLEKVGYPRENETVERHEGGKKVVRQAFDNETFYWFEKTGGITIYENNTGRVLYNSNYAPKKRKKKSIFEEAWDDVTDVAVDVAGNTAGAVVGGAVTIFAGPQAGAAAYGYIDGTVTGYLSGESGLQGQISGLSQSIGDTADVLVGTLPGVGSVGEYFRIFTRTFLRTLWVMKKEPSYALRRAVSQALKVKADGPFADAIHAFTAILEREIIGKGRDVDDALWDAIRGAVKHSPI